MLLLVRYLNRTRVRLHILPRKSTAMVVNECGNSLASLRFVVYSFVQHKTYCTTLYICETQHQRADLHKQPIRVLRKSTIAFEICYKLNKTDKCFISSHAGKY